MDQRAPDTTAGVVAVVADGVPATSFLAGEGVEAVVGDDVEAVLALHDVGHVCGIDDFGANPKIATAGLLEAWGADATSPAPGL